MVYCFYAHLINVFNAIIQSSANYLFDTTTTVQVFFFIWLYVLLLEIQLSRGKGWYPIKQFNLATFLCLSQAWISHIICHGFFFVFSE